MRRQRSDINLLPVRYWYIRSTCLDFDSAVDMQGLRRYRTRPSYECPSMFLQQVFISGAKKKPARSDVCMQGFDDTISKPRLLLCVRCFVLSVHKTAPLPGEYLYHGGSGCLSRFTYTTHASQRDFYEPGSKHVKRLIQIPDLQSSGSCLSYC